MIARRLRWSVRVPKDYAQDKGEQANGSNKGSKSAVIQRLSPKYRVRKCASTEAFKIVLLRYRLGRLECAIYIFALVSSRVPSGTSLALSDH
jgi:hypothetical protein